MRGWVLLMLSARSVGRNVRRSMLTAAAMVVGLALLIFSRALADGGHEQWIDSGVTLGTGHVALQAPEYLETGKIEYHLDAHTTQRALAAIEAALDSSDVVGWAPRLTVNGLASSASSALPVQIQGVDPALERDFSDMEDRLEEGRYLEVGDRLQAFVGVELARRLELDVGSRFVLTAQGAEGDVVGQLVRVAGIFRTAIPEMDEGLIHIPIETAREWLQAPGAVSTVGILLETARLTDPAVRALERETVGERQIRVLGWEETTPELADAIRIDDVGDYIFHGILFAIVALAILNSVMMAVLGRRREFGILQAMGLTGAETGLVVFGEGLFLTAASGVVGMIVGFVFTWGFFRDGLDFSAFMESDMAFSGAIVDPVIYPEFHLAQILLSVYSILVVGALASIYPAVRASRLDVAEAMKFDR
jgi:ABC-type lipoprotein release transport system permease subunit